MPSVILAQEHEPGEYECATWGCLRDADLSVWTKWVGSENLNPFAGPYCGPCWEDRGNLST